VEGVGQAGDHEGGEEKEGHEQRGEQPPDLAALEGRRWGQGGGGALPS